MKTNRSVKKKTNRSVEKKYGTPIPLIPLREIFLIPDDLFRSGTARLEEEFLKECNRLLDCLGLRPTTRLLLRKSNGISLESPSLDEKSEFCLAGSAMKCMTTQTGNAHQDQWVPEEGPVLLLGM